MLAVRSRIAANPKRSPPIIFVHGAANSAAVWTYWQELLAESGYNSHAVDLRGHGESTHQDLSRTTMTDYASDVTSVIDAWGVDGSTPVLIGWSMGGLVAMIAATRAPVAAVVGLAPSTPSRTIDESLPLREGEFDETEYGITSRDPDDSQPAMPDLDRGERILALSSLCRESRYARDERARGVVIQSLPCPLLIVTGTADAQWPGSRYDNLHLPAEHFSVEGASHWGLVLSGRALATLIPRVISWMEQIQSQAPGR
jgi:pimeloyl-ACP methyl ester carboxylesterase